MKTKRYERALALAILSIEESKKQNILFMFVILNLNIHLTAESIWKDYRSHTAKSKGWMFNMVDSLINTEPFLQEKKSKATRQKYDLLSSPRYSKIVNKLKQRGFYSECTKDGKSLSPKDLPSEPLADFFIGIAEDNLTKDKINVEVLETIDTYLKKEDLKGLIEKLYEMDTHYGVVAEIIITMLTDNMDEEKFAKILSKSVGEENKDKIQFLLKSTKGNLSSLKAINRENKAG